MTTPPDPRGQNSPAVRRLTAEHVTARALIEASSFAEAAPKILQAICETLGWEHGALWTVDREQDVLRCADIWTAPGRKFDEFDHFSRQLTFNRGVGLPGRVWLSGEPAWIPDVVRDPNFPRADIASREGLHAAFGFPVMLRGWVKSPLAAEWASISPTRPAVPMPPSTRLLIRMSPDIVSGSCFWGFVGARKAQTNGSQCSGRADSKCPESLGA